VIENCPAVLPAEVGSTVPVTIVGLSDEAVIVEPTLSAI
jgi:hypothetical protein